MYKQLFEFKTKKNIEKKTKEKQIVKQYARIN